MKKIITVLFFICMIVFPASALTLDDDYSTSGTIEHQVVESSSYSLSKTINVISAFKIDEIYIDFTDAKCINRVILYNNLKRASSGTAVNYDTAFDAYVDGVYYGSGVINVYDAFPVVSPYYVTWDVDFTNINESYAYTLTGDHIIDLVFEDINILTTAGVTRYYDEDGTKTYCRSMSTTSDNPAAFVMSSNDNYMVAADTILCSYTSEYENDYTYVYNSTLGYAHLDVDKGSFSTQWVIKDSDDTTYFDEGGYSSATISRNFYPENSIYAYVTFNVGDGETETELLHLLESDDSSTSGTETESISWDSSAYSTGNTATISFNVESPDYDTYDYSVKVHDTAGLKEEYELEDVTDNTVEYTFSPYAISSTYLAQLVATDSSNHSTVLAMETASFTQEEESYELAFSQASYDLDDTMQISYTNLPEDTQIYLRGTIDDPFEIVYTKSYYRSDSGSLSLTVPSQTATDYTVYAIYNGYTLATAHCDVVVSESDVSVYGVVYDASTGATISNAHVLINGSGPYSNSVGRYSTVIEAGTYDLVISKDGYNTQCFYDVPFFVNTNRNFYLTPSSGSSSGDEASLYGVVRDYETGEALESAMVTVKNSSFTKTTFTSSTGFYDLTGLANNTAYSVYSNLDGYDNYYNASVTVTGMTWLEFDLVDESYSLGSSEGSSTTEERTGRTAAQESLENLEATIPSLITFVVFMVFKAVMEK